MDSSKSSVLGWVAIVIALIACVGTFFASPSPSGPTAGENGTRYPHGVSVGYTSSSPGGVAPTDGKLTIGVTGTPLADVKAGTCSLIASSYTVAASSTVPMDCAIANVVSTDVPFAQFATSSTATFGGWSIRGASASTTAGFITISVVNGTGASGVIPASIASSTKYFVMR